jgi:pilus assembly protein CpaE
VYHAIALTPSEASGRDPSGAGPWSTGRVAAGTDVSCAPCQRHRGLPFVPPSAVLLVSADPEAVTTIGGPLTSQGHTVTGSGPDEAFAKAADHQLVIIDAAGGTSGAADFCREIRSAPALGRIPVLCVASGDDVEERIALLEAGADDVLQRPFDAREVEARVEALLLRFQRSATLAPTTLPQDGTVGGRRQVVAVFSPKGGVGTTTIATNIASARAVEHPDDVVVVDLDLRFGQVATHLDVRPRQTITDLVRDEPAMNEAELLRTYTTRHDSGLHVLAAPAGPGEVDLIEPDHIGRILQAIRGTFGSIVVDAGATLDDRTRAALQAADEVVLPIVPEMAALRAMHALLDHLGETGSLPGATTFVLNDLFARQLLRVRDVESALGAKIELQLPYDQVLYLKAVNEGVPVVVGAPKSAPAEALRALSAKVLGNASSPAAASADAPRGGLLGRLRSRP